MPVYDKDPPGSTGGSVTVETDPVASAALTTYIANDNALLVNGTSILGQGLATSQNLSALRATAFGQSAAYAYDDATCVGFNSAGNATQATAVGSNTSITAYAGTSVGYAAKTAGLYGVALGYASGGTDPADDQIYVGRDTQGSGASALGIGHNATCFGAYGIAMGDFATSASGGISIGKTSQSSTTGSVVIGETSKTLGTGVKAVVIGYGSSTLNGASSVAIGDTAVANGALALAMGFSANANGINSVSFGQSTDATGASSTAVGSLTQAAGNQSTAVGERASASGTNATAVGSLAVAAGTNTFAMGTQANASFARALCLGPFAAASAIDDVVIGNSSVGSNPNGYIRGNQGTGNVHFSPQVAGNIKLGVSRTTFYWGSTYVDKLMSRGPINDYIGYKGTFVNATAIGNSRWSGMLPAVELSSPEGTLVFSNVTGWAVRNTSGVSQVCCVSLNMDFAGIGAGQAGLLVDVNATENAGLASDAWRTDLSTAASAVHALTCWVIVPDQSYIRAWYHASSVGTMDALFLGRFYVRQI
jgi:hypothetical protein